MIVTRKRRRRLEWILHSFSICFIDVLTDERWYFFGLNKKKIVFFFGLYNFHDSPTRGREKKWKTNGKLNFSFSCILQQFYFSSTWRKKKFIFSNRMEFCFFRPRRTAVITAKFFLPRSSIFESFVITVKQATNLSVKIFSLKSVNLN